MKKFGKALALLAAGALLFGSVLSSCSSGSDDDDDDETPKITISSEGGATSVGVGKTLQLTAKSGDETLEGVTWSSSDTAVATVDGNGLVTYVADGNVTVTASKDGYTDGTIELTVGEEEATQLSVTWKFSEYASALNAPAGSSSSLGEEKTCGIAVLGKNIKVRSDGAGIDGTITEGVAGYAQLSNGKDGAIKITLPAGTRKLVLGAKVDGSKVMKVVAEDGETVLKEFTTASDNYADYTYDCTYDAETVVYVGTFTQSVTVNFKAFNVYTYAKKNAAPAESLFTANSTADGYSITVSAPAGIEYSTDNGTTWRDAEATITLESDGKTALASGTVLFRTKKTDDALASSTVSVTVEEYKDTSLPTADKPSADNFTAVQEVNGNDGSITLKSADGIEYQNGETWEAAKTSYTGLAHGTYKFRTAAVAGKSNASDALEVVVEKYEVPETYVSTTLTPNSAASVFNSIPARTAKDNVAAVITTAPVAEVTSSTDLTGYIGKGFWIASGTAAEYSAAGTIGYTKWAADSSTAEDQTANQNVLVPGVVSGGTIQGPFTITVTSTTANTARTLQFFVGSDLSTLFSGTAAYTSEALTKTDISYTYAGTDAVYVGFGTVSTDGKVYTGFSKITVAAASAVGGSAETTIATKKTYSAPTVTLSADSVAVNGTVTATAEIPEAAVATIAQDGTVATSTEAVTAELTWTGATVDSSDNKKASVTPTEKGTVTVTASYTDGNGSTQTSEAKTLTVTEAFSPKSVTISNDEATLGLTATTVESDTTTVATVELTNDGIVITSVAQGTAVVTFKDASNSGTIDVTVGTDGSIETAVHKYSDATTDSWTFSLSDSKATANGAAITVNGVLVSKKDSTYTYTTGQTSIGGETVMYLLDNVDIKGKDEKLTLTLANWAGTGSGTTKSKLTAAPDTSSTKSTNAPTFKASDKYGLDIKRDAIKISGVKGNVKITVNWNMSTKKDTGNRNLEVTVGSNDTETVANINASGAQTAYSKTWNLSEATDVYIGGSDEVYIGSIVIEEASTTATE